MPDTPPVDVPRRNEPSYQAPSIRPSPSSHKSSQSVSSTSQYAPTRGVKPVVQPKPQNLRVHISQQAKSARPVLKEDDGLAERFSQLRVQRNGHNLLFRNSEHVQSSVSTDPSSSTDYTPSSSEDSSYGSHHTGDNSGPANSPPKPSGPRSMPASSATPALPQKYRSVRCRPIPTTRCLNPPSLPTIQLKVRCLRVLLGPQP